MYAFNPYNDTTPNNPDFYQGAGNEDDTSSVSSHYSNSSFVECGEGLVKKPPLHFQAFVFAFNGSERIQHYVTLNATTQSGAAAKAITRAVQKARGQQNKKAKYPSNMISHILKGKQVIIYIRKFKRGSDTTPKFYVGTLHKVDPSSLKESSIKYKFKAQVYSLDVQRSATAFKRLYDNASDAAEKRQIKKTRQDLINLAKKISKMTSLPKFPNSL